MTEHTLKTLPPYWDAISDGRKNFDVRRDDRGFQTGDILILQRMPEPGTVHIRGERIKSQEIRKRITYILTGGQLGIEPGYVVMGLSDD